MNRRNSRDRQSSSNSGCSSKLKRVKCNCGNDVVVRTVRNGNNVGSKFYGCPLWPVSL
ncbi:DNA topoisomerase 3-alpha [Bienertia sinuspersici]